MSISARKSKLSDWINTYQFNGKKYALASRGCFELLNHTQNVYEAAVLMAICRFRGHSYRQPLSALANECHMDARMASAALDSLAARKLIEKSTMRHPSGIVNSYKPLIDTTGLFIPGWVLSEFFVWPRIRTCHRLGKREHSMNALRLVITMLMINYRGYGSAQYIADAVKSCKGGKPVSLVTVKKIMSEYMPLLLDRVGDRKQKRCIISESLAENLIRKALIGARQHERTGQSMIAAAKHYRNNIVKQSIQLDESFEDSNFMDFESEY